MSEEIKGASLVVPRSVMLSMFLNGATGFGMLMALLFCIGDVDAALSSPTQYPFMAIFTQATQSVAGAQAMTAIICVAQVAATIGACASASRMLWAFSRDRAVPGWRFFQVVSLVVIMNQIMDGLTCYTRPDRSADIDTFTLRWVDEHSRYPTFTHHARLSRSLQQPRLFGRYQSLLLLPGCGIATAMAASHWCHRAIQCITGTCCQLPWCSFDVGSMARPSTGGHSRQCFCRGICRRCRLLHCLATHVPRHANQHELCGPGLGHCSDRRNAVLLLLCAQRISRTGARASNIATIRLQIWLRLFATPSAASCLNTRERTVKSLAFAGWE